MWSRTSSDLSIVRGLGDGWEGTVGAFSCSGTVEVEPGGMLEVLEFSRIVLVA